MKNFAITGVAGYVAPRHLKAIKDTGNNLIAAVDPHDSVGILDRYFQDVSFFTEIERFDRHLEKLRRYQNNQKIDFLSICSPNHLHDAHIRLALRLDADAICEKPLVLKTSNIDALEALALETGKKINNILQLRVHPDLIKVKNIIRNEKKDKKYDIKLTYITSRGPWYHYSWKGDIQKSGGIASNIGIHFFDMLMWIFGKVQTSALYLSRYDRMSGFIELENAYVKWFLSINRDDLPKEAVNNNMTTYRSITIDGNEIEFTDGFTDLHKILYDEILKGNGFGLSHVRPAIQIVENIRNSTISKKLENPHPFLLTNLKGEL